MRAGFLVVCILERDLFKMKDKTAFPRQEICSIKRKEQTTDEYHIRWGNLSAALSWNNQFNHKLTGNFSLVYARNLSKYDFRSDDSFYKGEDDKEYSVDRMQRDSYSTIDDVGFGWIFITFLRRVIMFASEAITCIISIVRSIRYHRI